MPALGSSLQIQLVQKVKRQHEAMLMRLSNVVATGVGFKMAGTTQTDEPSVVVSVVKKLPASLQNRRWFPKPWKA